MRYLFFLLCSLASLTLNAQILKTSSRYQIFNDINTPVYSTPKEVASWEAEQEFNKKMKIQSIQVFDQNNVLVSESTIDENGLITQTREFYEENGKKHEDITLFKYDGNILSNLTIYKDENLAFNRIYQIDKEQNNIKRIRKTTWAYEPGSLVGSSSWEDYKFENTFDNNQQLISQTQKINIYKTNIERRDYYTYDAKGNVTCIARMLKKDTIAFFVFKYDEQNNRIEEEWRKGKGPVQGAIGKHIYNKYDKRNFLVQYITKDEQGNVVETRNIVYLRNRSNKDIITETVEDKVDEWQKKGKYETVKDFQQRVTEDNRNKQAIIFTQQAIDELGKNKYPAKPVNVDYDADNEVFKVSFTNLNPIFLKVPVSEAELFDKNKDKLLTNAQYTFYQDSISILSCSFTNQENGKTYQFDSKQDVAFNTVKLNMNFGDIKVDFSNHQQSETQQVKQQVQSVSIGKSDVDIDIPVNPQTADKTFAVIIANENYQKEVKVQFALNDGKIFKEYCEKTLGIPSKNIHFAQDASYGNMKSEIKWISDVMAAFNGQAKVIFYYAGHGMPNESDKSAYLLPVDGFSSDFETAIKLDDLYNRLTTVSSQNITVFLDACFSGSVRENGMLANARGVKIKPKTGVLKGNMIVFTAASGDETAYPYIEKQHGLFTYFLLKKLQATKGDVDYQTLSNYITENVKQQSIVVNQKSQTPQVNTSLNIQNLWMTMKIK